MKNKNNCMKLLLVLFVFVLIIFFSYYNLQLDKVNIHKATKEQIHDALYNECYDGLTDDIVLYLSENPKCRINDLIELDGIGNEKIKELKLVFRDNINFNSLHEYE